MSCLLRVDGWLAKFCILPRDLADAFAKTFEIVDDEERGWLGPMDTLLALRASNTNTNLTDAQEEFVFRVRGYKVNILPNTCTVLIV